MEIDRKIQLDILDILIEIDRICNKFGITYYLAYGSVLGAVRHKGFIPWDNDIDIMIEIDRMEELISALESNLPNKYKVYYLKNDKEYDSLKPRVGLSNQNHHKLHVDIFPMSGISNNKMLRKVIPIITLILYKSYFLKKFDSDTVHKNNFHKRIKHKLVKFVLYIMPISIILKVFNYLSWKYPLSKSAYIYNVCGSYKLKEVIPKEYLSEPVYLDFEGYKLPVPKEWNKYLNHMYGDYMTPVRY